MSAVMEKSTALMKQGFGTEEQSGALIETAGSAVAAQAKAMVEARYVMALRRPRNWDQVRQDLLRECRRPSFAHNKSAYYRKPIGAGVEGLGIRFVEVALRCMTNVLVETTMVYEDNVKELHRVAVTDLESNLTYPLDVRVSKTVERSKPLDDGSFISMRQNSAGRATYTVPANDDDLLNKRAALISKAIRTLGLRIIPGDLQDEGEEIIKQVRLDRAAEDPDGERKRIVDAFGELGVKASDLAAYLGHSIESCSPAELVDLRGVYGAIKDGEASWKSVMDNKQEQGGGNGDGEKPTYPQADFDKNLPSWTKLIETGKKSVDVIIATAKAKAPLTDEQITTLKAIKPVPKGESAAPAAGATAAGPDAPLAAPVLKALRDKAAHASITDADILKHLNATSMDELTVAQGEAALKFIANPTGA